MQQRPVGWPLEKVAIDIMGPLVESEAGNKYILVLCDYFTKWTEAYALPDQVSLKCHFILRFHWGGTDVVTIVTTSLDGRQRFHFTTLQGK